MEFKDYYQTLGVSRDASQDEIKRAYRKLARKYHPDVSKETNAEARFKEIGEAYEVLRDPEKREAYDNLGRGYHAGEDFRPPPGWERGSDFSGGFSGVDAGAFSDFFEALFGHQHAARGPFGAGFRMRGEDQHARIRISLEEAYHGATRTLTLQVPEVDDRGRVRRGKRSLSVRIPAGIRAGQKIRLPGQGGGHGPGGPEPGDLYLEVEFEHHPYFSVDGRDVHLTLPVTPWEAALGTTVAVPTLGGSVEMKVPAGSRAGSRLRLKGRGLPGEPPGDQYVTIQIVVPPVRNDEDRELLRRMARQMPLNPRQHLERQP